MDDSPGERQTALVADDHDLFAAALAAVLERELGFNEVIAARSFDQAVAALAKAPQASFATFDLSLPGLDEPGRLAAVRATWPALRIAVVSRSASSEAIRGALAAGADGHVPKLLGLGELTAALRAIANRATVMSALDADEAAAEPDKDPFAPPVATADIALPPRQREVLRLLAAGHSNKEIARRLNLAEGTVKGHLAGLFRKLGVRDRAGAVTVAAQLST